MRALKPTLKQKKIIQDHKLVARNWLVIKEEDDKLVLANKATGNVRTIRTKVKK